MKSQMPTAMMTTPTVTRSWTPRRLNIKKTRGGGTRTRAPPSLFCQRTATCFFNFGPVPSAGNTLFDVMIFSFLGSESPSRQQEPEAALPLQAHAAFRTSAERCRRASCRDLTDYRWYPQDPL